jgi:hypothetical protein
MDFFLTNLDFGLFLGYFLPTRSILRFGVMMEIRWNTMAKNTPGITRLLLV